MRCMKGLGQMICVENLNQMRCVEGSSRTGSSQHDGAGFAHGAAAEVDEAVLPDHDLLDQRAVPQLRGLRVVKCRRDLTACHQPATVSGAARARNQQSHKREPHKPSEPKPCRSSQPTPLT